MVEVNNCDRQHRERQSFRLGSKDEIEELIEAAIHQTANSEEQDTDDGFSDDDGESKHAADEFLQQLELKQKLKHINEEFSKDATPTDVSLRTRRVRFREKLVEYDSAQSSPSDPNQNDQLICPTASLQPSDDEEQDDLTTDSISEIDWRQDLRNSIPDSEEEEDMLYDGFIDEMDRLRLEEINYESDSAKDETVNNGEKRSSISLSTAENDSRSIDEDTKEENDGRNSVLVEKDGEFRLVDASDVRASVSSASSSSSSSVTVKTKNSRRTKAKNAKVSQCTSSSSESTSSTTLINLPNYQGNPRSKYGITPAQHRSRKEKEKLLRLQKFDEKDREEQEKREKRKFMEGVFKSWLRKKDVDKRSAMKTDDDARNDPHIKETHNKRCVSSYSKKPVETGHRSKEGSDEQAFKSWLRNKKEQRRKELRLDRQRLKELEQSISVPDRSECEYAFQQWLKKKKTEKRLEELKYMSRQRQRRKEVALFHSLPRSKSLQDTIKAYFGYTI